MFCIDECVSVGALAGVGAWFVPCLHACVCPEIVK